LGERAPVLISRDPPGAESDQMLINLGAEVPSFFGRFERVAEIFVQPQVETGRQRYKYYRDRGYPLFHHDMEAWEDR
jgi:DNA polymerase-3 subunit chi